MKYLSIVIMSLFLTACGAGSGIDVYDGTWSMCHYKNQDGSFTNTPFPTGGLPVGGGDGEGNEVQCTPIPARDKPEPAQ